MLSPYRVILGVTLALGGLTVAIPGLPAQNPNNPKGVDVSAIGQGTIGSWTSVKNAGISFAFCKATEGTTFKDPQFDTNWAAMKSVGIVRGAYHFARPTASPTLAGSAINQANFFVNTVKPGKSDLQLVLDFEATGSLGKADLLTWLQAFCGQIQSLTHTPAIIYCSPSFWTDNLPSTATNMNCGLWIANYGVTSPTIPAAWASTGYAFWQYTSSGTVSGISGNVDLDTYNGSMTSLLRFTYPRDPLNRR